MSAQNPKAMHKHIDQSRSVSPGQTAAARPLVKRAALASAAALALMGVSLQAQALALGAISVRSALGEPLRADIEIPQISSEEASTLQASMGSLQAFKAAGVDYSPALAGARVSLQRRPNGQAYLRIVGNRAVNEPYVGIVIEANWANGRVVRDYTLLLDPPGRQALPAVVATQPQTAAPEPAAPPARPAVAEQVTPQASPAAAPKSPRAERTGAVTAKSGDQVTVQRGDTLSRIAGAHAIDGVSLDQMLLALLKANPNAFIRGNVNLVKTGAVLQIPSAEQAQATPRQAARQAVVAQSRDFQSYRHAVAKAAPAQPQDASGRTASGSVQAQVRDSQAPAAAPDQLKISKGDSASTAESQVARSRQAQEQADREAELQKNIGELTRLQGAASAPAAATTTAAAAAASASSAAPAGLTVPVAAGTAMSSAASDAVASNAAATAAAAAAAAAISAASAAVASAVEASAPAPAASEVAAAASEAEAASAAAAAAASAPVAPKPPAATPAPVDEPSFLHGFMANPLLPIAGAGLIALLVGFGFFRSRQRKQKDASRDSEFIESRLQPDSFFGASGGQQVNTKERASGSSSMAYSPSQLDAAGDVDPVAEADVYLAYGRDMQAEEILKEALLTHPNRISIHRKLAEIYAKRRDARALDAIATEAHALTEGDGPDWQAIASLGAELDPNNPMYKPGGMPLPKVAPTGKPRQFGADTEPQTAQVILGKEGSSTTGRPPLDLNLDLGDSVRQAAPTNPPVAAPAAVAATVAAVGGAVAAAAHSAAPSARQGLDSAPVKADSEFVDLDLDMDFAPPSELAATPAPAAPVAAAPIAAKPASAPPPASNSGMIEFDMDALSVDPDSRSGDIKTEQPDDADDNPLSTKLSLAQEFRAIGDIDGARALAAEVATEAAGALKVRAERFLTEL